MARKKAPVRLYEEVYIGGEINRLMRLISPEDRPEMQLRGSGTCVIPGNESRRALFQYHHPETHKAYYAGFYAADWHGPVFSGLDLTNYMDEMTETLNLFNWLGYTDEEISIELIESFFDGSSWIGDSF